MPEYEAPTVVEIGVFSSLTTTSFEGGLHFAQVSVGSVGAGTPSPGPGSPTPVTGRGGGVIPGEVTNPGGATSPDGSAGGTGSVLGETATGDISDPGDPGVGDPGDAGGGDPGTAVVGGTAGAGGSLPFTGFAAGAIGALGAVTASAGVALRRTGAAAPPARRHADRLAAARRGAAPGRLRGDRHPQSPTASSPRRSPRAAAAGR